MKIREAASLVNFRMPVVSSIERKLTASHTIADITRIARRKLPRSVFDYVAGGADEELSLKGNGDAIREWRYLPAVLTDVSVTSTASEVLGRTYASPIGLAPTGYTRMISPQGEIAVASSAAKAGIPYVLSTMATTSLESLAQATPDADRWFQLYVWKDRDLTTQLIERAGEQGYDVLEVAVDTAVSGRRVRDVRNGFTIPPQLTLKSILDIGTKPGYWLGLMNNPMIEFANVAAQGDSAQEYTIENITKQFDPSVTWTDLAAVRELWKGRLVLKGPVGPTDAKRARDLGVDGVHLSNHGGRQLDRTVAPIDLIRPVRDAVGRDMDILVDSGFRHGTDIATAVALGADAAFIGRPYLYGLVAAGAEGVDRVISILKDEFLRTMQLLGVQSVTELQARGEELLLRQN